MYLAVYILFSSSSMRASALTHLPDVPSTTIPFRAGSLPVAIASSSIIFAARSFPVPPICCHVRIINKHIHAHVLTDAMPCHCERDTIFTWIHALHFHQYIATSKLTCFSQFDQWGVTNQALISTHIFLAAAEVSVFAAFVGVLFPDSLRKITALLLLSLFLLLLSDLPYQAGCNKTNKFHRRISCYLDPILNSEDGDDRKCCGHIHPLKAKERVQLIFLPNAQVWYVVLCMKMWPVSWVFFRFSACGTFFWPFINITLYFLLTAQQYHHGIMADERPTDDGSHSHTTATLLIKSEVTFFSAPYISLLLFVNLEVRFGFLRKRSQPP